MEGVESLCESPFSKSKGKGHSVSENGDRVVEQMKTRKKNLRHKNKHQFNGKDIEDSESNGQKFCDNQVTSVEVDSNTDSNNTDHDDETINVKSCENGNKNDEGNDTNDIKDNEASPAFHETQEETVTSGVEDKPDPDGNTEEYENTEEDIIVDENSSEGYIEGLKVETESSAKKEISESQDSQPEAASEVSDELYNQDTNDTVEGETNGVTQEEEQEEEKEQTEEGPTKNDHENGVNGTDVSLSCEEANNTEEPIQASPDTATKEDLSIPSKITNFFGKFAYSMEQKQDTEREEISSTKKTEKASLNHPYLSKVSGRRGIKERLNSSATSFSEMGREAKTPENSGVSLDDSFRVRTNPPRLNSMELNENPTLRKFKGKRCLNAGDEPEEDEDVYLSTVKRRKLDEKSPESGILGSIFWSPFKKRALDNENQLKLTTESKLSRLLSPFWFWKKATEGQKGK